ncbi:MAG: hypothetical protein JO022_09830, partial [Acidobacteriaceae bacterium]|nr:hypothetical protein [Acidobacteriaceae bacterium]
MWRERIREFLFPGTAEADQGFRREIDRLAILGLRIIAGVQIGVSVFLLAIRLVLATQTAALSLRLRQAAVMIVLGVLNGLASKRNRIGAVARPLAVLSSLATAGVLIWASLIAISISTNPNDFIPGQITLVMLVAVTAIPLRPMQTLALGLAIGVEYLILSLIAERQFLNGLGPDENYTLFVIMLAALCTGITAILYQQRVSNYRILQQTIEAAEALREVQTRVVMTESASSLSRLAAAVSHEMNNPVGALLSGVDTLLLLASKQATSSPNEHERIVRLQSEVRRSIEKSAERLRQLVSRMQRFTNLDQAEVQKADVNELLKDVAAL